MAKWVSSLVLDNGLNHIVNNANEMRLIKNYAAGDTYATVDGNTVATVAMATTDFTLGDGASGARKVDTATKSATASSSTISTDNLHIAFIKYDSTTPANSVVVWVTDETTDQVVLSGNTVNFPALTYTSNQPT